MQNYAVKTVSYILRSVSICLNRLYKQYILFYSIQKSTKFVVQTFCIIQNGQFIFVHFELYKTFESKKKKFSYAVDLIKYPTLTRA